MFGVNPFSQQQQYGHPFANMPGSSTATLGQYGQYGGYPQQQGFPQQGFSQQQGFPPQQIVQLLQALPHQLQLQQQQLQQIQQLVQLIPAQLWQLQQWIQFLPHQIQQLQQGSLFQQPSSFQQPFGQTLGLGGFPGAQMGPQIFGQPGQVM